MYPDSTLCLVILSQSISLIVSCSDIRDVLEISSASEVGHPYHHSVCRRDFCLWFVICSERQACTIIHAYVVGNKYKRPKLLDISAHYIPD